MGEMGTRGVNGIKVATISSGAGGSFTDTFNIPDALKGRYQISIRLQSVTGSGYFAYNWFYNNYSGNIPPGPGMPLPPGYVGYPTFSITSVDPGVSVKIKTYNLPKNDSFDVLMGYMGTQAINGIKVDTVSSGSGGTKEFTFAIPPALQ